MFYVENQFVNPDHKATPFAWQESELIVPAPLPTVRPAWLVGQAGFRAGVIRENQFAE